MSKILILDLNQPTKIQNLNKASQKHILGGACESTATVVCNDKGECKVVKVVTTCS